MRRRVLVGCVLAGALLTGGCAKSTPLVASTATPAHSAVQSAPTPVGPNATQISPPDAIKVYRIDETEKGKTLVVTKGDRIELTLSTTPGTGYHWEYSQKPNASVLKQVSDTTYPAASPMPGAPQKRKWVYSAVGVGSTSVQLQYLPPGGGAPGDTYRFNVRVAA